MTLYTKDDFRKRFDVTDEVFARIETYEKLLIKWNKAINLVSPKTISEGWHRHFIDSAQISAFIPENTKIYADLGCGGGFPGLVIALMRPELDIHLIESDERKGQFMRSVVRESGASNVTIHTKRVEDATGDLSPDFVTARALASLEKLFAYCLPWAEENAELQFCFMKGERAREEIEDARKVYNFTLEKTTSITDPNAQILMVTNLCTQ